MTIQILCAEAMFSPSYLIFSVTIHLGVLKSQTFEGKVEISQNKGSCQPEESQNGTSWADIFVKEMMNASDWNDVRTRAMKTLEVFERDVITRTTAYMEVDSLFVLHSPCGSLLFSLYFLVVMQKENNSLKEQLQCLLRDNQILKRAVAVQHECNLEHEEKIKEVQHLKQVISQYQEQVRALEVIRIYYLFSL